LASLQFNHSIVRALSALGAAVMFTACSNSASSGAMTPSSVPPGPQSQPARIKPGSGGVEFVYVTSPGYNSVSAFAVDTDSGALEEVKGSPFMAGDSPEGVAIDPTGRLAYVANAGRDGHSSVSGYAINATTGALEEVKGSPFKAGRHFWGMAIDSTGKFAYATDKSSGSVFGFAIDPSSGALDEVKGSPFKAGTDPTGVAIDPTGSFVYVTNTGSATISGYSLDASSGALDELPGSPYKAEKFPGFMAIDPKRHYAYVTDRDVVGYVRRPSGNLDRLPRSLFKAGTGPAAVAIDPAGKFVYVTNRGSDNVYAYAIGPHQGELTEVKGSPFQAGSFPEGVAIDSTGTFAYVANFASSSISGYTIAPGSGALAPISGSPFKVQAPASVATCRVESGRCKPPPL
jgi:6-phosphogluconolactonase (cycloisomerase 2 family)